MGKVIGIDLGTTNSCMAILEGGVPVIIPNREGSRTTPSVVACTRKGERLVGEPAKRQAVLNAEGTIFSVKRHMGEDCRIALGAGKYTPQEISAMILRKLKQDAEDYLGCEVKEAVITVPAYFSDAQRQATRDAGRIAGLRVHRIINEPTAAALAYGLEHGEPQKILVYDFGGGTFDVSVIEIGDALIEVLATSGDNHLGGDDIDCRVADWLLSEFQKKEHINLKKDVAALGRIREAARKAKEELSQVTETTINLPFLWNQNGKARHLEITLTRARLEELSGDLIRRTRQPVLDALEQAGIGISELDRVLLVGGSARMPAVQEMVHNLTGLEPNHNLNPDECVALGACIQGGKFSNELTVGAAGDIILMDVTPLSLSVETMGGIATHLIERNSTIPTRQSKIFTTAGNFQTSVDIKVLQGENRFAKDNRLLGNFRLTGIRRALAGIPQIEVIFDIDANGIVNVSARDLGTGKQQQITISSHTQLSEAEIERARREAAEYEKEDALRREWLETMEEVSKFQQRAETAFKKNGKKLERENRHRIKAELAELRKSIARVRMDRLLSEQKEQTEQVRQAWSALQQRMEPLWDVLEQ